MIWFWGLLVLVVILMLCTWILVFFVDFRSCANVICTSDVTGGPGDEGEAALPAPENDQGAFGPFSIVPGARGKRGASKTGFTGGRSSGGLITGPTGPRGTIGPVLNDHDGVFFKNEDYATLSTADGLVTASVLLNYYEVAVVKSNVTFVTNGTEFPTATLTFVRFGNQVTLGVVIGDVRPELLFNNKKIDAGRGILQPNYMQFSTAVLNNVGRFFVVRNTPWQLKQPIQVLLSTTTEFQGVGATNASAIQPGQLLIRTQLAQIIMQIYASPSQARFCTVHMPGFSDGITFYGLFGIQVTFQASWNLL